MHCNEFDMLQWGWFDDSQRDVSLSLLQLCISMIHSGWMSIKYTDLFRRTHWTRFCDHVPGGLWNSIIIHLSGTRIRSVLSVSLFTEAAEQDCVLEHTHAHFGSAFAFW